MGFTSRFVIGFAFVFASGLVCSTTYSQLTKDSKTPPEQNRNDRDGTTTPDKVAYNDQKPPASTPAIAKPSISDQPQFVRQVNQKQGDEEAVNRQEGIKITDWVNMIVAVIVAIFTGLLYWVSRRQTKLMDKQTMSMENQTKLMESQDRLIKNVERAYVFVGGIRWISHPDPISQKVCWSLPIPFQNFGSTPAKNLETYVCSEIRENDLPDDFPFTEPTSYRPRTLGPNLSSNGNLDISADIFEEAKNGTKNIYIWGRANYRDTLDDSVPHITKFCYKIIVSGNPQKPWEEGNHLENLALSFIGHKNYNEAD